MQHGDSPVAMPADGGSGNDTGTSADSGQDATTDSSADVGSPADASDAGSDDGGIVPCTSAASLLVTDTGMHHGIAVDGQNLYWANQSTNKIMKWPLAGGSATPLASNLTLPTDVTVD